METPPPDQDLPPPRSPVEPVEAEPAESAGSAGQRLGAHLEWYRFALLLTGQPALAAEILREVFAEASHHLSQFRNPRSRRAWLVRSIRDRTAKRAQKPQEPSPPEAEERSWKRVAALPEPARSAFALFYSLARESGAGSEAHCALLADWLGLKPEAFAEALAQARLALSSKGAGQAVVEEAGKTAEPELATAQTAFERQWHREVEAIEFPSGLTLPDLAGPSSPRLRSLLRQPAVLAIGVALLVVLGVVFFAAVRKIDDFPGKELVAEMIEEPGAFDASKMEKIEAAEAGSLGDWFLLKGFDNFSVPPELEHARTVACRVYKYEGHPVAQLALSRQDALLLVFHCTEMKVPLDSLQWYIYQQDDWAVATRGDGKNCYVVAFVGNSDDMGALLHKMAQSEGKSPGAQEANESAPPGNGK